MSLFHSFFFLLFVSLVDTVYLVLSILVLLTEELVLAGPERGQGHTSKQPPLEENWSNLAAAGGRRHLCAARPERDSKVCRRKVSPPTWGEDVGGARAEDGEQRWEDVSGRRCVHHPSPGGAG